MVEFDYCQLRSCGDHVFISGRAEIRRPHLVSVGNNVAIDSGFYCTVAAEIGDWVHIGPYVSVIGGAEGTLKMGHFTTIAAGSRLICVSEEHKGDGLVGPKIPDHVRDTLIKGPIALENFASVGTNAVIYPNVTLAEGSVLGACSLLTQNTEPWVIYMGIPARPILQRRKTMKDKAKALGYDL